MGKMTKFLLASSALLLAGCGDQSLSGTYVSHDPKGVDLLQLTQTPDHHLTGTIRRATLNNDGRVEMLTMNVSGAVDGHSVTLTVFHTPLQMGENVGGTVTNSGLDFTVPMTPGSAQAGVSHFDRGNIGDYDAAVTKLTQAGSSIQAQLLRDQQITALNREVQSLTHDLDSFVTSAQQVIARTPRIVAFYPHAVADEQAKLALAQRLLAGNGTQQGQARTVVGQMRTDQAAISNSEDAITNTVQEYVQREAALSANIERFNGNCQNRATASPSDTIPDAGPCKNLAVAVAAYRTVLDPLHSAIASAVQAKVSGDQQLSEILRTANDVH